MIRIEACGICGTDKARFRGYPPDFPYSPGHEYCGTVVDVGQDINREWLGGRVCINPNLECGECEWCLSDRPNLCNHLNPPSRKSNGGFADYVSVDSRMAVRVDPALPVSVAVLVEPMSCALNAIRLGAIQMGEKVAVIGGGPFGCLIAIAVQAAGAEPLIIESRQSRREYVTEAFGFSALPPRGLTHTIRDQIDLVFEATGSMSGACLSGALVRKAGRILLAGTYHGKPRLSSDALAAIVRKEAKVRGSWLNPHTFGDALEFVAQHSGRLSRVTTQRFELGLLANAFGAAVNCAAGKILVTMHESDRI